MADMEDRANLKAMARELGEIRAQLRSFRNWVDTSFQHALGESNDEGDEIVPGNGDDYEVFEDAGKAVAEADVALRRATDILAAAEGYRWFDLEYEAVADA